MIYLLIVYVVLLCVIAVWFVLGNKAIDERYEKELDRIYRRKR